MDNQNHIAENRIRAMKFLNRSADAIATAKNVHSNQVVTVDTVWRPDQPHKADGMVTRSKEIVLASDSADCPIVLLADEEAQVIGLAHAGWRGAQQGIIEETVNAMILLGAQHKNLCAVISPCITQDSYEVDENFYSSFLYSGSVTTHPYTPLRVVQG